MALPSFSTYCRITAQFLIASNARTTLFLSGSGLGSMMAIEFIGMHGRPDGFCIESSEMRKAKASSLTMAAVNVQSIASLSLTFLWGVICGAVAQDITGICISFFRPLRPCWSPLSKYSGDVSRTLASLTSSTPFGRCSLRSHLPSVIVDTPVRVAASAWVIPASRLNDLRRWPKVFLFRVLMAGWYRP